MPVINSPFKSKFGFESTGFIVDNQGNISAKSISLIETEVIDPGLPADFVFSDSTGNFRIASSITDNPTITVFRAKTTIIDLELTSLTFNIVADDKTTFFSTGLVDTTGNVGDAAQGLQTGRLTWAVPVTAPDTLYYADATGTIFGTINVQNAPSAFSEVEITAATPATNSSTGALTVAGGVGIAGDLYVGGSLNIDGIGITKLSSSTNLEIEAANNIIVKIDGNTLGVIGLTGSNVPVVDTTINNTIIGAVTPATAAFTSATVSGDPASGSGVANKTYVDRTAVALSIAFGL
jgi:hypothetical protein